MQRDSVVFMATSNPSRVGKLCVRVGAVFVASMLVSIIIGPTGCGGISSNKCRFEPERCRGDAGALCSDDYDCHPGLECCTEDHCGDGMCTLSCKDDYDCPGDMLCEHDQCFYACASDRDCAPEMSCEHDNSVCEYR
jgi:hypothetical protein